MRGWTVTTEAAKSTTGRENYFNDKQHPNHKNTERIIEIAGSRKAAVMMSVSAELYRAKQRLNRRGGRPPATEAVEFVLELPKGFRPTTDEWRFVVDDVVREIAKTCDVDVKELLQTTRAVVHQQDQTITRDKKTGRITGSGDHCHLLVGKFTPAGSYLRNLQRKTCTNAVKAAFSKSMLERCNFDWQAYAERENIAITTKNSYQKRSNKWIVDAKRYNEILKDNLNILQNQIAKFLNQADKWQVAYELNDQKQMHRQANRMNKEVRIISGALQEQELSPEMEKLLEQVDNVKKQVNEKSGTEIVNPITIEKEKIII